MVDFDESKNDDNKLIRGREGWLFLNNDKNKVIDQISGKFSLNDEFDENWRMLFQYRQERLKALGARYDILIAPNKEVVYSQFLPEGIQLVQIRPVHRVIKQAEGLVPIHYPLELLKSKSETVEVYPTGDTHWNLIGALIGYREYTSAIGVQPISDDEIEFYDLGKGDLSDKVNEPTRYIRGRLKQPNFTCVSNNNVSRTGNKLIYENVNKSLPSCVMFRDSFGTILLEVLAQTFSRFVAVWQPNIDYSIVKAEMPDFVLTEQAERFMISIPNDATGKNKCPLRRKKTSTTELAVRRDV
jgi:alginate O-acetyltransferase complex protein AlgJ